ncbi:hypothetical protein ISN45_Aa01g014740 [Arabidopsis thaliana x Arabidopsis arenosa]|uniref:Uncharacterized protein n=1 Tax=Arabidopsis thaliana x Arabidopsis arenosa TaxID=1240361 RepID=A0A8T2C682_9BRAS|nr:hypothetical protein ISN45_Aa01g014740 [Arabidopsis thaliana x Arabidopsis arenosa]
MIKGGGGKSSGYSADLMVCFPSRTHLSLPSKSISSPSHSFNRRQNAPHHRRSISKLSGSGGGVRQSRGGGREVVEEPTSPKVTCAGQIKVRSSKRDGGSKNWQSLMAEIEKIHRSKSESKFFGIKRDVMGFLTCLRDFDFRCFGAFPPVDIISDDEEEEDEEEEEEEEEDEDESSGTVFSKWLMVLHEKQNNEECVNEKKNAFSDVETAVPPPNALLLMRCRSAPVKNWLEEKKEETEEGENRVKQSGEEEEEEEEKERVRNKKDLRSLMEEEKKMNLVVMNYDTNYYKLSTDIAKETWVVGGIQDPLFRSRSWKK